MSSVANEKPSPFHSMATQMSLWEFALVVCPCRRRAFNRWYDAKAMTLSAAARLAAEVKVSQDPQSISLSPLERIKAEEKVLERRAENLRSLAQKLLGTQLPDAVRKALLSGPYQASGINSVNRH